jgi:hypothetical protein
VRAGGWPGRAVLVSVTLVMQGCAAMDVAAVAETHRLADAPYYAALRQPQPAPGSCARVLPVTLDPELPQQFGYGDRVGGEFEPIVRALNDALARRAAGSCVLAFEPAPALSGRPPRVWVGSAESEYAPDEAADQRLPTDRFQPMVMHVERPDAAWRSAAAGALTATGAPHAIAVQLGVSQYMKGYSGAFRKEVVLGTGYRVPIRFLTAEDKPVEVLHLTGVLVDANGLPVRAGAEGIVLRDTPFLAQSIDATRTFDPKELQGVLTGLRREDLPGAPLALDVALDNLLAQLTRSAVTVPAR